MIFLGKNGNVKVREVYVNKKGAKKPLYYFKYIVLKSFSLFELQF